jgi:dTDP-4-dehydrorhamnose 3,5-epimerase
MDEIQTRLNGPRLFEVDRFADERGSFMETWQQDRFEALGITDAWVQDNQSTSRRGVLRGLHFQVDPGQAKLVRVAVGRAIDVVVDLRRGSSEFGNWEAFELGEDSPRVLYIPGGFAHGFCAVADATHLLYKVSVAYDPTRERGLAWNDPDVGIEWPLQDPILSERDRTLPRLGDLMALDHLPSAVDGE